MYSSSSRTVAGRFMRLGGGGGGIIRASEAEEGRLMRDWDCEREGEGEGEEVVVTGVERAMIARLAVLDYIDEIQAGGFLESR